MLDSEEQVQQRLPIPLPKVNFRSSGDSNEETDDDAASATPSEGNTKDDDPEAPSSLTQFLNIGMSLRSTVLP